MLDYSGDRGINLCMPTYKNRKFTTKFALEPKAKLNNSDSDALQEETSTFIVEIS